jgi:hypothetical protein
MFGFCAMDKGFDNRCIYKHLNSCTELFLISSNVAREAGSGLQLGDYMKTDAQFFRPARVNVPLLKEN